MAGGSAVSAHSTAACRWALAARPGASLSATGRARPPAIFRSAARWLATPGLLTGATRRLTRIQSCSTRSTQPASFSHRPLRSASATRRRPSFRPGVASIDLTITKSFSFGEARSLDIELQTFNTLNHFSPGTPNTSLTWDFNSGAQSNSNFGVITSATVRERQMVLSAKFGSDANRLDKTVATIPRGLGASPQGHFFVCGRE